ncbi:MAG: hypothetical protein ACSHW6_10920, partial [Sulfitobacter geojensis]
MNSTTVKQTLKTFGAASALALGLAMPAAADGHGGKVKIGLITTLTGGGAGLGVDIRDGFLLAIKQAGNEGIEVVVE